MRRRCARLDALGRLRVVQISFRNFNLGDDDVVVDDVAMPGTTTAVDEVLAGNATRPPTWTRVGSERTPIPGRHVHIVRNTHAGGRRSGPEVQR